MIALLLAVCELCIALSNARVAVCTAVACTALSFSCAARATLNAAPGVILGPSLDLPGPACCGPAAGPAWLGPELGDGADCACCGGPPAGCGPAAGPCCGPCGPGCDGLSIGPPEF